MTKTRTTTVRAALMRVAKKIVARPQCYNQEDYCGSVCCIAGHLHIKMVGAKKHASSDFHAIWKGVSAEMGLRREPEIFNARLYRTPFYDAYAAAKTATERATVAAKAIEWWLRENPEVAKRRIQVVA